MNRLAFALLAAVLVFARVLAPVPSGAAPSSAVAAFDRMAREAICHAVAADDEDGTASRDKAPAGHAGCLLCPACHLVGTGGIAAGPVVPGPVMVFASVHAGVPPATGPPPLPRFRGSAPPTGPPFFSA